MQERATSVPLLISKLKSFFQCSLSSIQILLISYALRTAGRSEYGLAVHDAKPATAVTSLIPPHTAVAAATSFVPGLLLHRHCGFVALASSPSEGSRLLRRLLSRRPTTTAADAYARC